MITQLNWSVRFKNPWFWIGIVCVLISAMGIDPKVLTSWEILWSEIVALFTNPFRLASTFVSIVGVLVDPTTKGANDSKRAMRYTILGGTEEEQNGNAIEQIEQNK